MDFADRIAAGGPAIPPTPAQARAEQALERWRAAERAADDCDSVPTPAAIATLDAATVELRAARLALLVDEDARMDDPTRAAVTANRADLQAESDAAHAAAEAKREAAARSREQRRDEIEALAVDGVIAAAHADGRAVHLVTDEESEAEAAAAEVAGMEDDPAAITLLRGQVRDDEQAVALLVRDAITGEAENYATAVARGLCRKTGIPLRGARAIADRLVSRAKRLHSVGRRAPLSAADADMMVRAYAGDPVELAKDLPSAVQKAAAMMAAGPTPVEAAQLAVAMVEAKPAGRLRFQTEEAWNAILRWHIHGLLPEDGLAVLFADPGCGKSLLAVYLACCTAVGADFAGRATRAGRVVYACPDSPSSTKRRLSALPPEARRRIVALPELSLPADAEELATWLQSQMHGGDPVRLLIVDTWDATRDMPGAGYTQEDRSIIENTKLLREIAERLRIAVIIVHHSTKDRENPTSRGSFVLKGRLEWEAYLRRIADGVVELVTTKARDGEMGTVGQFRISARPHPADGEPVPGLEYLATGMAVAGARQAAAAAGKAKLDADRLIVLRGLAEAPGAGRTKRGLAESARMEPTRWYRVLRHLREDGLVEPRNFYLTAAGQIAARDEGAEAGS